jgi:hypothetical protein
LIDITRRHAHLIALVADAHALIGAHCVSVLSSRYSALRHLYAMHRWVLMADGSFADGLITQVRQVLFSAAARTSVGAGAHGNLFVTGELHAAIGRTRDDCRHAYFDDDRTLGSLNMQLPDADVGGQFDWGQLLLCYQLDEPLRIVSV